MSARIARWIVLVAAGLITEKSIRQRYREQWLADVEGALELELSPLAVALGAAAAAVRIGAGLPGVSGRARRSFGAVQLLLAAPAGLAAGFYLFARLRLGVSQELLFTGGHDPKDLLPPLLYATPVMLALGSALSVFSVALAPVGLVLGVGGSRAGRWLPWAGALAGAAAAVIAGGDFGQALQTWLLD